MNNSIQSLQVTQRGVVEARCPDREAAEGVQKRHEKAEGDRGARAHEVVRQNRRTLLEGLLSSSSSSSYQRTAIAYARTKKRKKQQRQLS